MYGAGRINLVGTMRGPRQRWAGQILLNKILAKS